MAEKNEKKRNEILRNSYILFSKYGYNNTPLSTIAKKSHISKSLLQYYYPQKQNITRDLLDDMLKISSQHIGDISNIQNKTDLMEKMACYMAVFFHACEKNLRLFHFVQTTISEQLLLDIWLDIIFENARQWNWWIEYGFTVLEMKTGITCSVLSSVKLIQYRENLGVDVQYACDLYTFILMSILGFEHSGIEVVQKRVREILSSYDFNSFLDFCQEKIEWFVL